MGDSPIGGGLLGVGIGATPDPTVAAAVLTVPGGVEGAPAFGGVTGRADSFGEAPSGGFFKAPGLVGVASPDVDQPCPLPGRLHPSPS